MSKRKRNPAYEKWMDDRIVDLRALLFLQEWHLRVIYDADINARASINVDTSYYTATVRYAPEVREDWEKEKLYLVLETVVHELCHILTEPLYEIAVDAITNTNRAFVDRVREQQTERTKIAILPLLPKRLFRKKI